jgi:hypothetical protein
MTSRHNCGTLETFWRRLGGRRIEKTALALWRSGDDQGPGPQPEAFVEWALSHKPGAVSSGSRPRMDFNHWRFLRNHGELKSRGHRQRAFAAGYYPQCNLSALPRRWAIPSAMTFVDFIAAWLSCAYLTISRWTRRPSSCK